MDAPVASGFTPTDEQGYINDWFQGGTGNLVVRAYAGTGKTTTAVNAIAYAPEKWILFAAFNKSAAVEMASRMDGNSNVLCSTWHSVGFQALKRAWPKVRVDDRNDRGRTLTEAVCPPTVYDSVRKMITKLHTKARDVMPLVETWQELVGPAMLWECVPPDGDPEVIAKWAFKAMQQALKPTTTIDFADMIYLPLKLDLLKPRFDMVVIDEAQDTNPSSFIMARRVLKVGGRMCVIGDNRQGIYAFRGADSQALDRLKRELDAEELGLTVTWRCDSDIVAEAQKFVPGIKARPGAPKGIVRDTTLSKMLTDVQAGDFILSRTNAPLVSACLALLRAGRRAKIEGRDIGRTLLALCKKCSLYGDVYDVAEWAANLNDWRARELRVAEKLDNPARADMVIDQAACLLAISDGAPDVAEIEARIEHLFDDKFGDDFIICSSVHKAKGLEADRVFILRDTFLLRVACVCGHRHPGGRSACARCPCTEYRPNPLAQLEEENILYVAITRAKHELVYVASEVR